MSPIPPEPHFIYTLRVTRPAMLTDGPTPAEAQSLGAHAEYLRRLTDEGMVVLAGRTTEDNELTRGYVVFRASDADHAARIMSEDPAVRDAVMTASLQPFRIARLWDGAPGAPAR